MQTVLSEYIGSAYISVLALVNVFVEEWVFSAL